MNLKKGDQFYIGKNKDTIMTILNPNTGAKFYNIRVRITRKSPNHSTAALALETTEECFVDDIIFQDPNVVRVEEEEEII